MNEKFAARLLRSGLNAVFTLFVLVADFFFDLNLAQDSPFESFSFKSKREEIKCLLILRILLRV